MIGTEWLPPVRAIGTGSVGEEAIFRVLRNRRRRYALHYLKQREDTVSLGELAERIAAWETGTSVREVGPNDRKRVSVSLLQGHLPTLEEEGMIEFDEETSGVRLTETARDVDVYVELVPEDDIQWSTYYVGIAAFGGAFLAAAWAGVDPLTALPPIAWIGFVVVSFSLSSIVHYAHQQRNRLGNAGPPPE